MANKQMSYPADKTSSSVAYNYTECNEIKLWTYMSLNLIHYIQHHFGDGRGFVHQL